MIQKAVGRCHQRFGSLFVTSMGEGTHSAGSFHHCDPSLAWDFRKPAGVSREDVVETVGPKYDVVEHADHFHIEYDVWKE